MGHWTIWCYECGKQNDPLVEDGLVREIVTTDVVEYCPVCGTDRITTTAPSLRNEDQ